MLNNAMLVGRLIEFKDDYMKVSVSWSYKKEDGIYEYDEIPCKLELPTDEVKTYLTIGDLVGIKGRIEMTDNKLLVIVSRLTFLSSSHKGE